MKWYFNRDGKKELVVLRRWVWGVIYNDGTEFKQYDDDGVFHQFAEIDQSQVRMLSVYKYKDMGKRFDLLRTEGMQLFMFYLNTKPYYLDEFVETTGFGYKKNGQSAYTFILPDDRVVVSDIENIDLPQFDLTLPKK